jgi:hypothetical protein
MQDRSANPYSSRPRSAIPLFKQNGSGVTSAKNNLLSYRRWENRSGDFTRVRRIGFIARRPTNGRPSDTQFLQGSGWTHCAVIKYTQASKTAHDATQSFSNSAASIPGFARVDAAD